MATHPLFMCFFCNWPVSVHSRQHYVLPWVSLGQGLNVECLGAGDAVPRQMASTFRRSLLSRDGAFLGVGLCSLVVLPLCILNQCPCSLPSLLWPSPSWVEARHPQGAHPWKGAV